MKYINFYLCHRTDGKREWFRYRKTLTNGSTFYHFYLGPYTLTWYFVQRKEHGYRSN